MKSKIERELDDLLDYLKTHEVRLPKEGIPAELREFYEAYHPTHHITGGNMFSKAVTTIGKSAAKVASKVASKASKLVTKKVSDAASDAVSDAVSNIPNPMAQSTDDTQTGAVPAETPNSAPSETPNVTNVIEPTGQGENEAPNDDLYDDGWFKPILDPTQANLKNGKIVVYIPKDPRSTERGESMNELSGQNKYDYRYGNGMYHDAGIFVSCVGTIKSGGMFGKTTVVEPFIYTFQDENSSEMIRIRHTDKLLFRIDDEENYFNHDPNDVAAPPIGVEASTATNPPGSGIGSASVTPSVIPSGTSSVNPSVIPSGTSSVIPSVNPSVNPSVIPSGTSSVIPSGTSSVIPSVNPSVTPSGTSASGQGNSVVQTQYQQNANIVQAQTGVLMPAIAGTTANLTAVANSATNQQMHKLALTALKKAIEEHIGKGITEYIHVDKSGDTAYAVVLPDPSNLQNQASNQAATNNQPPANAANPNSQANNQSAINPAQTNSQSTTNNQSITPTNQSTTNQQKITPSNQPPSSASIATTNNASVSAGTNPTNTNNQLSPQQLQTSQQQPPLPQINNTAKISTSAEPPSNVGSVSFSPAEKQQSSWSQNTQSDQSGSLSDNTTSWQDITQNTNTNTTAN
jgi:hypothetical protein